MTETLNVQNRRQAILYVCEMKGQISDGRWENSQPANHWHKPCDAEVVVVGENATNVGISWRRIRGYNFYETDLQELLGERMKRYVQFAMVFEHLDIKKVAELSSYVDSEFYWKDSVLRDSSKMAELRSMTECDTYQEFTSLLDAIYPYSDEQLHKDLVGLTQCFRKDQRVAA